jgi:hypothetical protein
MCLAEWTTSVPVVVRRLLTWGEQEDAMRALFDSQVLLSRGDANTPGYRVLANTRSLYSVRLWGQLEQFWADRFSLGLSSLALTILNGFARQDGSGRWGAEFLITPTGEGPDPATVDYLALTRREAPDREAEPLLLDDYTLDGSPEHGPTMYLALRAPDRVGFLGSLVRTFARHQLVPREMTVSTCNGVAYDRFLLQTAGGRLPSEETRRALAATLDATLRRHQPRRGPTVTAAL